MYVFRRYLMMIMDLFLQVPAFLVKLNINALDFQNVIKVLILFLMKLIKVQEANFFIWTPPIRQADTSAAAFRPPTAIIPYTDTRLAFLFFKRRHQTT